MENLSPDEIARIVELGEADLWRACFEGLPAAFAARHGFRVRGIGGATVSMVEDLPSPAFNCAIGLGLRRPAREAMIDDVCALFAGKNMPVRVSVSPAARPGGLTDRLLARGFRRRGRTAKMIRGAEAPPKSETDLRIERVDYGTASHFGAICRAGFELPAWMAEMFASSVTMPGMHCYLARDGDVPAAVGALFVRGECGVLCNAATLPKYRRRGAQGALMSRRIRDAIDLGCKWLITDTAEETADAPNPSFRNMVRAGFELAYLRPDYVFEPEAARR